MYAIGMKYGCVQVKNCVGVRICRCLWKFWSGVWVYVAICVDLCGSVGVGILVGIDVGG